MSPARSAARRRSVPQLHDLLADAAEHRPEHVALRCDGASLTYSDIAERAGALARTLAELGVRRGDRVMLLLHNRAEAVIAFWGVLEANAVVTVVHPQTKAEKLAHLVRDCTPAVLVTEAQLLSVVAEAMRSSPHPRMAIVAGAVPDASSLPPAIGWDEAVCGAGPSSPRLNLDVDLASIVYTSGSTGDPKGVMLTHRNMIAAATSISDYLDMGPDDVVLDVLPLAFDYGLYQMIMSAHVGARLVLERSFAFPGQVLGRIAAERVTGLPGVPTMFAVMAGLDLSSFDLSSIRYVTSTGAALPRKHVDFLRATFPSARIYSMYGLTECKRCTYLPPEDLDRKPGSVGVAIPNTELWIVDREGRRVGPGEVGQLVIRGATVMRGYWEKPLETELKLRPGPLFGERVLYTGDLCRLDEDGYLYFVARMDDVIKSRGEKVPPRPWRRSS
ncbi:MAG: AMP-binding protein [Sandaracinaceae bacterium]|nr:AMP-binding protein [Sandaracinaceae bacterium]